MTLTAENVCVCSAEAVLDPDAHGACVPCGTNQTAQAGVCTCVPGFAMNPEGACITKPPVLGEACDPQAPACPSTDFPHCQAVPNGGYCTKAGCAAPADCPSGYFCDTSIMAGVCKRAPRGQGMTCASAAECASNDATLCAPMFNMCVVQGCTVGSASCAPNHLCCDLTHLGPPVTACLPVETCP